MTAYTKKLQRSQVKKPNDAPEGLRKIRTIKTQRKIQRINEIKT
jgi:hypothetical protein